MRLPRIANHQPIPTTTTLQILQYHSNYSHIISTSSLFTSTPQLSRTRPKYSLLDTWLGAHRSRYPQRAPPTFNPPSGLPLAHDPALGNCGRKTVPVRRGYSPGARGHVEPAPGPVRARRRPRSRVRARAAMGRAPLPVPLPRNRDQRQPLPLAGVGVGTNGSLDRADVGD